MDGEKTLVLATGSSINRFDLAWLEEKPAQRRFLSTPRQTLLQPVPVRRSQAPGHPGHGPGRDDDAQAIL